MDDKSKIPAPADRKIETQGRTWAADEVRPRYDLAPHKVELIYGKLFWNDEERLLMLGLLLENCGANAAVRLGDEQGTR